jgi:hypothetical protein
MVETGGILAEVVNFTEEAGTSTTLDPAGFQVTIVGAAGVMPIIGLGGGMICVLGNALSRGM